jgi:hypothetical protein
MSMSKKGLDTLFVHYGIRREDMAIIEALCNEYELDIDWVKEELLKVYHERKIKNQNIEQKALVKIIEKALLKINK